MFDGDFSPSTSRTGDDYDEFDDLNSLGEKATSSRFQDENQPPKATKKRDRENRTALITKKPKLFKNLEMGKHGGIVHGRVLSKSNVKNWQTNGKDGQLCSFVMEDSSGSVQSNALFNKTNNPVEIHLTKLSQIKAIQGKNLPKTTIESITIAEILHTEQNKLIDLIGIVYDIGPSQNLSCRDGIVRQKYNVKIVDDSLKVVSLGIWKNSHNFANTEGKCLAMKNLIVREYAGKKVLATTDSTVVKHEQDDVNMKRLQNWWIREGQYEEFEELEVPKQLATPTPNGE
ncbi:replication factor A protein 1-like [Galendromus occidentalis]|uniref:Replication factor A protein 1-like n=1 Tax=Galendromus occidentalis TaxID=34638 RepID=A0AAJ7SHV6_9ACAR|nr:replication factor A protein 1-like [Galendromus occidentalis]